MKIIKLPGWFDNVGLTFFIRKTSSKSSVFLYEAVALHLKVLMASLSSVYYMSTYSCPVPWSMTTTDVLKFDGSGTAS